MWSLTSYLGGEGAAGDVFVVELDDDAVVPGHGGQVGHGAGAVLVVLARDLRLGRALHRQREAPCRGGRNVPFSRLHFR